MDGPIYVGDDEITNLPSSWRVCFKTRDRPKNPARGNTKPDVFTKETQRARHTINDDHPSLNTSISGRWCSAQFKDRMV